MARRQGTLLSATPAVPDTHRYSSCLMALRLRYTSSCGWYLATHLDVWNGACCRPHPVPCVILRRGHSEHVLDVLTAGRACVTVSSLPQWTVYRGEAYDLTAFIDAHPAGNWLIQLALGRDCTAAVRVVPPAPGGERCRSSSQGLRQGFARCRHAVDAANLVLSAVRPGGLCLETWQWRQQSIHANPRTRSALQPCAMAGMSRARVNGTLSRYPDNLQPKPPTHDLTLTLAVTHLLRINP